MSIFIIATIMLCVAESKLKVMSSSCEQPLGLSYTLPVSERLPDDSLTASTERNYCLAKYGRLNFPSSRRKFGVWCPDDEDEHPWFQVDFGRMVTVRKATIASQLTVYQYVKSYSVSYKYKEGPWFPIADSSGTVRIFEGMKDMYERKTADFGSFITARYIRIYPKTKYDNYCMQLEVYGCIPEKDCNNKVGISDKARVSNEQFSSSSERLNHPAYEGRLHNRPDIPRQWGAWCANDDDISPWFKIDLRMVREVSALATQGHPYMLMDAWTESFKVNYSIDDIKWEEYENGKVFEGNDDYDTVKSIPLNPVINTRYIKFIPLAWHELACLRIEIYECLPKPESIPALSQRLDDVTINRGEPLSLRCSFQGQPLMKIAWRRNGELLKRSKRINMVSSGDNRTVTGRLDFRRIIAKDNATWACLAWYPNLMDIHAKSVSVVTVVTPTPVLDVLNVSNTFSMVNLSFIEPFTKDIQGFVIEIIGEQMAPDIRRIPADTEVLNETKWFAHKLMSLRPYVNYTLRVAMWYVEDEIGPFMSIKDIATLQDVPYGAPLSLLVRRASMDALYCTWDLPESTVRNGPITHYEVKYLKSVEEGEIESPQYRVVNTTEFIIYNLEAGSNYEIAVRAFTKIGAGPLSYPPILIFTGAATEELHSISKMLITKTNAAAVSVRLQNITNDRAHLNKHDVGLTIDILEKVVNAENSSEVIGESLVQSVSNILKANKTVLEESEMTNRTGTRYVKMLEKWLEGVDPKEKELEENSENIIVKKVFLKKYRIEEEIKFSEASSQISIPSEVLPKNTSEDSIYFVYYKTNKFFRETKIQEEKCINGFTVIKERSYTPVISGDIVGTDTSNLSAPVVLKFKVNTNTSLEDSACVYWDFKANDGKGDWSTKGCSVYSIVNQTIICHCNHLTNFAAMMDIYAHTSKICGRHQILISYISIIGCCLSLIGLFITFLTYFMFKSLHRELSAKVLVQLCASLFVVILTFVIGIEQVHRPHWCVAVAIILHYFTLASFMWMMIEAILMYQSFVTVWPPRQSGDIYKASIAAWGIPFVIVLIAYLTNAKYYGGKHYCHVTSIPLYATYLAPMGIVIIVNFILFVCIMHGLSTRPDSHTDKSMLESAIIRCRRAFGITILMGLTWSFGFGLASGARLLFSYLFAVFNGLQGFSIFVFYCLAQKNARLAWKRFFTCDNRSEQKRNTDSYFESRRLSSGASYSVTHHRGYSDVSSIVRTDSNAIVGNKISTRANNEFRIPLDRPVLEDIIEQLSPPNSPEMRKLPKVSTHNGEDQRDSILTAGEDELLNMKLQAFEERRPKIDKIDVKKYSSYRALSGPNSYDVFNLVRTPSAKSLRNDGFHRKSAEFINRKSNEKLRSNRNSMFESSTVSSYYQPRMRSVKSLEQMNKQETNQAKHVLCDCDDMPLTDISFVNISNTTTNDDRTTNNQESTIQPKQLINPNVSVKAERKNGQRNDLFSDNSNERVLITDSDTLDPRQETYVVNAGTLKSDATTMTDMNELNMKELLDNPLYGLQTDNQRSRNDILQWLHEGNDQSKGTDSDYSSTYYKTSRSSSIVDLNMTSTSSEGNKINKRRVREKETLDSMVLAPLMGNCSKNNKQNLSELSSNQSSADNEERSELSEAGYSASEEEIFDRQQNFKRTKSKKRKNRLRSPNMSTASKSSQYMALDEKKSNISFL